MLVTGLSLDQFRELVETVSTDNYDGNVIVQQDAYALSKNRFRAQIRCKSGRGSGARTTTSGRHMPIACWHAYRDVIAWIFRMNPNARVQTSLAIYRGSDDFQVKYLPTGRVNVGSMVEPVTMPELCQCEHEEAYAVIEPYDWDTQITAYSELYEQEWAPNDDPDEIPEARSEAEIDAEGGGRRYTGRLTTYPAESTYIEGDTQGAPDDLLDRISVLIDGDPWNPAHP